MRPVEHTGPFVHGPLAAGEACDAAPGLRPYLEHFPEPGGLPQRVALCRFPFRLGRDVGADLVVYSCRVSKAHAVIVREDEDFLISDLGSTNGTFVNGRRVKDAARLHDGDIVHLAHKEFRFGLASGAGHAKPDSVPTEAGRSQAPNSLIQGVSRLRELIDARQAVAFFQPIVSMADRRAVGYEALGRGRHGQLPTSPGPLFSIAQQCRMAPQLSRVFRDVALAEAPRLPRPCSLFLNTHPEEMAKANFADLLRALPTLSAGVGPVVLEVHEDFVADTQTMKQLRARLKEEGMRLAYDDFGVGQARLFALAEVPPDFIKLDMTIVQGLTHSRALQDLVRALARVCEGLDCQMIAEGVETEEELAVCREVGCTLAQGYLFSRPVPLADLPK